ncbi:MAG: HAD family phosphatase [Bacteroidetes bacterium]|nr:MAG: HAD family phosphatase [Bacteroidota bacterium]
MPIETIIFDLGGVLIDWNPRYLYRKLLPNEAAVDHFLTHIATNDWNEAQDAGRSLAEGTAWLVNKHPEQRELIEAFYGRWEEMLGGPIPEVVDLLRELKYDKQFPVYALTNWSAETFPIARARYDFLQWFDGILVSGEEKMRKPQAEFYQLLEERFPLKLATSLFIDDNARNVAAAKALGLRSIHYQNPTQLRQELSTLLNE